ncbi:membrane protein [Candidatus Francisella endociliophora]|uniref:Membrane protein n=1 Tax=Candidatus Francisella endociliophora TaxID=653937 RepID=A0A097EMW4_9GAMM|nr:membrane protein [Francisella sp. FSC1006]AIT08900.1 membrane protein [Francisella sp. FSC1006]
MLNKLKELKTKFKKRNSYDNSYASELVSSIHRTDIKATILSIIWAAGPVTIIAITLGYYLSHGTRVPLVTVAYFSLYVFFVGLVGFISKIVFDSLKHKKQEKMQERFLSVVEESYQNLYLSKKMNLAKLTDQVRDNKVANEILSKSHPTSKEIFYIFNLHFSKEMAEFAEIIYLHRENGFPIDTDENKRKLRRFYKQINNNKKITDELRKKFLKALIGKYTSLKEGVERKSGFLSKIYNSAGQYSLFDLDDASHAISLFIELLSGRKIYYFKTTSKFDDVKKDYLFTSIEKLRNKITQKYNHILGIYKQSFLTVSEVAPNLDLKEVINVTDDVTENIHQLEAAIVQIHTKKLSKEIRKQTQQSKNRFNQNVRMIKTQLKRLDMLLEQWHSLSFSNDEKLYKNVEHELVYVFLEEKIRMSIAYKMYEYTHHEHDFISKEECIKAYARQAIKLLQEPLSLDEASVLTAIEMSNGANLSSIKLSNSINQKLDTTYNLCKSVKTDIVEIRRRIKKILMAQYV